MTATETWSLGVTCSPPSLSPARQLQWGYFLPRLLAGASLAPAPGTWWARGVDGANAAIRPLTSHALPMAPWIQRWKHCHDVSHWRKRMRYLDFALILKQTDFRVRRWCHSGNSYCRGWHLSPSTYSLWPKSKQAVRTWTQLLSVSQKHYHTLISLSLFLLTMYLCFPPQCCKIFQW